MSFRKGSKNEKNIISNEPIPSQFKRKRFNSDSGEEIPKFNIEIQLQGKKVMSEFIRYRYNLKQLFQVYDANYEYFRFAPNFDSIIDDICIKEKKKELNILSVSYCLI